MAKIGFVVMLIVAAWLLAGCGQPGPDEVTIPDDVDEQKVLEAVGGAVVEAWTGDDESDARQPPDPAAP